LDHTCQFDRGHRVNDESRFARAIANVRDVVGQQMGRLASDHHRLVGGGEVGGTHVDRFHRLEAAAEANIAPRFHSRR
jgi:hypothetical protein